MMMEMRMILSTGGGNIIVQNEHFVHYFAAPGLPALRKNILFVIDISGSMGGGKIVQARDAMLRILNDLSKRSTDRFNILLFDDTQEKWREEPRTASGENIASAKGYVREKLAARGGTNIYQALMTGLDILLGDRATRACDRADMIVFLTDGDPTAGEVQDPRSIIEYVTGKNRGRASIFSLGFGFDMDFAFLSELSEKNRGFARRIYDEGDASIQLENFYDEIGTPVLCDVTASYSNEVVDMNLLTTTQFPLYFLGKEIVVSGKTKSPAQQLDLSMLDARLQGTGANGVQSYSVATDSVVTVQDSDVEANLTEKLWAYMYIKKLLKNMEKLSSSEEKNATKQEALQMSLDYALYYSAIPAPCLKLEGYS
nr:hypothetical protein BaRGS_032367 [Batillaria attramentaria]